MTFVISFLHAIMSLEWFVWLVSGWIQLFWFRLLLFCSPFYRNDENAPPTTNTPLPGSNVPERLPGKTSPLSERPCVGVVPPQTSAVTPPQTPAVTPCNVNTGAGDLGTSPSLPNDNSDRCQGHVGIGNKDSNRSSQDDKESCEALKKEKEEQVSQWILF